MTKFTGGGRFRFLASAESAVFSMDKIILGFGRLFK
jgi:hypothetical protein